MSSGHGRHEINRTGNGVTEGEWAFGEGKCLVWSGRFAWSGDLSGDVSAGKSLAWEEEGRL